MRHPDDVAALVGALSGLGETLGQLDRLAIWPGLTPHQRLVGFQTIMLERAGQVPTVEVLVITTGLRLEDVTRAIGARTAPVDLLADGSVLPSHQLAYGMEA